jgi:hypothetical protein
MNSTKQDLSFGTKCHEKKKMKNHLVFGFWAKPNTTDKTRLIKFLLMDDGKTTTTTTGKSAG